MLPKTEVEVTTFPLVRSDATVSQAVVAIVRRLSTAQSLSEIMRIATQAARTLLDADGVTFVLRDGDQCYYAEEDAISPLWRGKRFPMSACISGWCMTQRKSVAIEDIYQDSRIPNDAYRSTFVRSLAMAPVRQEAPIAAMGSYWSVKHNTSPAELDLLQTVANSAALAVAKIELEQEREKTNMLHAEIAHRLRNLLAVIDALSRQTLRTSPDLRTYSEDFSRRLTALAHAQNLLMGRNDSDLKGLIYEQLMIGEDEEALVCRGPDINIQSELALDLGLALHELGTNARKYGALSRDGGKVLVEWSTHSTGEGQRALELWWRETGGPPVSAAASTGFGGVLLRHAFDKYNGSTCTRFDPDGFVCKMTIPIR